MSEHSEHAARVRVSTPCAAWHINFGGGCLNCGWVPSLAKRPHPADGGRLLVEAIEEYDRRLRAQAEIDVGTLAALPEVEKLRHIVATYEDLARRVTRASQGSVAQLKALHELAGMVEP